MKLFFLKDDSLYRIFKTLQKISTTKQVEVYIEKQSPFFDHPRRGKQIKELIEKSNLDVVFATKSEKSKLYFEEVWLKVLFLKKRKVTKILHMIYLFFFNIKKFHLYAYTKKNYTFYVIFFFEVCVVLFILYLLYGLVIPSTTVNIVPAYQVEDIVYNFRYYPYNQQQSVAYVNQLTIPYYTWSLKVWHTMNLWLKDFLYSYKPAEGVIRIVNTTQEMIPLLKWSQLVTNDWLVYTTDTYSEIPPKSWESAWYVSVGVTAQDVDVQNRNIWERWNIKKWSRLFIRKLKQSYYAKDIYAEVLYDFTWWETLQKQQISSWNINDLYQKIDQYLEKNKTSLIKKELQDQSVFLLPFIPSQSQKQNDFIYDIWQGESIISWSLTKEFVYAYIRYQDIEAGFNQYLAARSSDSQNILDMREESLVFLTEWTNAVDGIYVVPTQMSFVKWYNFSKDPNRLFSEIQQKIVWLNQEDALQIMLAYPQIATVEIVIKPPRYTTVSRLKSRIYFKIQNNM